VVSFCAVARFKRLASRIVVSKRNRQNAVMLVPNGKVKGSCGIT
jgi:hypothetical protein